MKVIKKPVLPIQTCTECGSFLRITYRDLKRDGWSLCKNRFICKVCKKEQYVNFGTLEEVEI